MRLRNLLKQLKAQFMIQANDAVVSAQETLRQVYSRAGEVQPYGLQLEEEYLSDDESSWLVTLSFLSDIEKDEPTGLGALLPPSDSDGTKIRKKRIYKTFEVGADSGNFMGMRIRPVVSA
jgi:uncharacterized membrane protein